MGDPRTDVDRFAWGWAHMQAGYTVGAHLGMYGPPKPVGARWCPSCPADASVLCEQFAGALRVLLEGPNPPQTVVVNNI
ncbi:hypothetical protein DFJ67_3852 [Asanoa ferruginea]|uniref:Uncharacterized protein n=1 Tax=Asanoa ferruginea TaxID=53367 RepID=A0A3D9ZKP2_9ACTN|nr:hypothetical protein DFJ67_3852 [Asanoa ferruginea]GIF52988.1 hypothetical protein Afe04nite_75270 [Asanoa ferruginea]